jgi:hypothetical protein
MLPRPARRSPSLVQRVKGGTAMLTRKMNAFLKIAIIFLAVIVIIAGITINSFSAQSDPIPQAMSSSEKKALVEEQVELFLVWVDGKGGYIDKTGQIVINPQFNCALDFHEGLAAVEIGDKWGFINKAGELVIKSHFDDVFAFHEGLAEVGIGGKWGYIDKTGRYVWKLTN